MAGSSLRGVKPATGVNETDLVLAAACAETHSSHPIARAVLDCAKERKLDAAGSGQCVAVHGKGLKAVWKNTPELPSPSHLNWMAMWKSL